MRQNEEGKYTGKAPACIVDYHLPWGIPPSGDYDLEELFAWIDGICKD